MTTIYHTSADPDAELPGYGWPSLRAQHETCHERDWPMGDPTAYVKALDIPRDVMLDLLDTIQSEGEDWFTEEQLGMIESRIAGELDRVTAHAWLCSYARLTGRVLW
jgi:hypothetical protein